MINIKTSKIISLVAMLFVLSLFAVIKTPFAFACDCAEPGTPSEELKEATAVFSGIVADIDRIDSDLTEYEYKVRFYVEKIWKGISDKTVVVSTGMGGGDCGYEFREGERYFVYTHGDSSSLGVGICSRTKPLSAAEDDLSSLGEGKTPFSQSGTPSGKQLNFSNNSIFIIFLAAIILVFIIYKVILLRKKVK